MSPDRDVIDYFYKHVVPLLFAFQKDRGYQVEEYLETRLTEANISFPKTHDLTYLLELFRPAKSRWSVYEESVRLLTDYAVEFRYPGQNADKQEAQEAIRM